MAVTRISDLTAGTLPIAGSSLFEVSVVNAAAPSGYDSRKYTLANLFTNPTFTGVASIPTLTMPNPTTGQVAIKFYRAGAPLDQKTWEILSDSSGSFGIRAVDDAYSVASSFLNVTRGTSYNVGLATFYCPIRITVADGSQQLLLSGTTRAVRLYSASGVFTIEGVDITGAASYQPLSVG